MNVYIDSHVIHLYAWIVYIYNRYRIHMVANFNIDVECKVIKIMPLYYRGTFKNDNIMALFVNTYSMYLVLLHVIDWSALLFSVQKKKCLMLNPMFKKKTIFFEEFIFLIDTKRRAYSCNFVYVDFSFGGVFLSWPRVGAMQIHWTDSKMHDVSTRIMNIT